MLKRLKSLFSTFTSLIVIAGLTLMLIFIFSNIRVLQTGQSPEPTPIPLENVPITAEVPTDKFISPTITSKTVIVTVAPLGPGTPTTHRANVPTSDPNYIPTNTPQPGEVYTKTEEISPSQRIFSKVINLAEGLTDDEIFVYIVQSPDGTYTKYLVPVGAVIHLNQKDIIVNSYPLITPVSTPPVEKLPDSN